MAKGKSSRRWDEREQQDRAIEARQARELQEDIAQKIRASTEVQ